MLNAMSPNLRHSHSVNRHQVRESTPSAEHGIVREWKVSQSQMHSDCIPHISAVPLADGQLPSLWTRALHVLNVRRARERADIP